MTRAGYLVLAALMATALGCNESQQGSASDPASTSPAATEGAAAKPSPADLQIEELKVGDGAVAENGKTVAVHYTGWLTDGTKFDSSVDRGQPLSFVLGTGNVIQGWDRGVQGMRVGGKRKLTIPPALGYGARGYPPVIPADATLVFEVELMNVQ
jgi:FKBP-type peptidyl-prolyl cis-trans isomerase